MKVLELFKIVILCVVASIVYGIAHDLVTAHIAVRYFTEYHPHVVDSQSPVVMALVWGVIATWWMGVILGLLLGVASLAGSSPHLRWRRLVSPVVKLLIVTAFFALVSGLASYLFNIRIPTFFAESQQSELRRLTAVGFAHSASYFVGFFGGLYLTAWAVWKRYRNSDERNA